MQFYANKDRLPLKTILFFAVILFIAFLPVSSFLFFLKNDAFTGYFPPKFFMSESIHAGYLPLWNPYINFGIPQYGDMSSGYWSPVTWLIASTAGYNAYTFTLEVLLYILAGGIGMYKLTSSWQLEKPVCIIAGLALMCCGYNTGHLQHFNWLSGVAFLPWCFWSYQRLLNQFSFKNAIRMALLFYLLVSSAHPGISISAFYFFGTYLIFHFFENKKQVSVAGSLQQQGRSHLILLFLFLLLAAGMIAGYLDILPHFVRSEKISLQDSLLHPSTAQSWISALLPFATTKNDALFNTDISMRNSYFSICLLLFFIVSLAGKKTKLQFFLLCSGFFFVLLASGGLFKTMAYKFIPLIGYVRLNGEFRIFAIFSFILVGAIELNRHINTKKSFSGAVKWIYYILEVLTIVAIAYGLYKAVSTKQGLMYSNGRVFAPNGLPAKLKSLIDFISFYDTLWIQGIVQLALLWGIKWCLRVSNWKLLQRIVVADMILATLFNLPFTGVGKASVAEVQQVLNQSPKHIPVPSLTPIQNNVAVPEEEQLMVGDWSFYNKQPGVLKEAAYPIVLKNMAAYFEQDRLTGKNIYTNRAFVFCTDSLVTAMSLGSFSPQQIDININSSHSTTVVLQQNHYPHWIYSDGKEEKPVNEYGINFMSAPVKSGSSKISFLFDPVVVKWSMLLSLLALLSCCLYLLFLRREKG